MIRMGYPNKGIYQIADLITRKGNKKFKHQRKYVAWQIGMIKETTGTGTVVRTIGHS
jgi:hypothetical protein